MNFFAQRVLIWRDVTRGIHMLQTFIRPRSAAAAAPAIAATASEDSSDEVLVERIAAGDKLAMQVLFARHRTSVYRWLLRFVGNRGRGSAERCVLRCMAAGRPLRRARRRHHLAALDRALQGTLGPPSSHRCGTSRNHRSERARAGAPRKRRARAPPKRRPRTHRSCRPSPRSRSLASSATIIQPPRGL